jgi:hypothetical protein
MTARTVTGAVVLPGGTVPTYATVLIELVAATSGRAIGWVPSADIGVGGRRVLTCDGTGSWSIDLRPNALIVPAGTVYRVSYSASSDANWSTTFTVSVPDSAGPHRVEDILADPPASLPSAALSSHLADTTAAHAASAISFAPAGTIAATDVQAAIAEVASEAVSRANHTGTQAASTISDFGEAVATFLVAGSGITLTHNDPGNSLTIAAAGASFDVVNAKGDLIVGTADDTVARLAVGAAWQSVVVDSTTATGLAYRRQVAEPSSNTFVGGSAGNLTLTGGGNVGVGQAAQQALTSGTWNSAVGEAAQQSLTTGAGNVAMGKSAQFNLTTGSNNFGLGALAQRDLTTGGNNVAIGTNAMQLATTATSSIAIGHSAMSGGIVTGSGNVAIGPSSMSAVTSAANNVAIGSSALSAMSTAAKNVAIGHNAATSLTVGEHNVCIGEIAGTQITSANDNTIIGRNANFSSSTQRAGTTIIGANARADGANAVAIGLSTSAGAAGAVAIGRSSAGVSASTSTADDIALGVAAHRVTIAGTLNFAGTTATTVGAAGAASALPATPTGYVVVMIAGTQHKMPYYAM